MDFRGTKNSVREALKTRKRVVAVLSVGILTWVFFVLLVNPVYSFQMVSGNPLTMTEVLPALVASQFATGVLNFIFPVLIAGLVGIVSVTTGLSLYNNYTSSGSLGGTLGGAIGVAGAGCASCGAGLLTLLGLSGGVAILPFNGLGVQGLSLLLILASLEYTGRQDRICSVDFED